jgi:deoxyribodipyrimidine photolyase
MIFSAASTNKSIKRRIILHWFRHGDLRLYDNQALTHSSHLAQPTYTDDHSMIMSHHIVPPVVIPIFIFHEKIFGTRNRTPAGTLKCGVKRAQFILESVQNLRHNLQTLVGSKLLVATGDPCQTIDSVLTQLQKYYLQKEGRTDPLNNNTDNNNEEHQSVQLDLEIVCQKEYTTEEREALIDMTLLLQKYTQHIDEEHHTHNITTGSLLQQQLHQPMKRQIQEIWGTNRKTMTTYVCAPPYLPSEQLTTDTFFD